MAFEVARQAPVAAEPGKRALDKPALGLNDKAMKIAAFDDLDHPGPGLGHGCGRAFTRVAAVGEDPLYEGKQAPRLAQEQERPVAILDVGRMHDDVQQETERVDEDMALAARRLLARIVALRVERGPPFSAPRAVWLSMIAAVGLASRPWRSRS